MTHPLTRRFFRLFSLAIIVVTLSACFPAIFRPDLAQGNLIDQDKLAELEIGMEPRQVRRLLGTPLLTDTFTKNRWDYYYSLRQGTKTEVHHHITVFFENGRVSAITDQLTP